MKTETLKKKLRDNDVVLHECMMYGSSDIDLLMPESDITMSKEDKQMLLDIFFRSHQYEIMSFINERLTDWLERNHNTLELPF